MLTSKSIKKHLIYHPNPVVSFMKKPRIIITDPIHPEAIRRLSQEGLEVTELPEDEKGFLSKHIEDYQAILCRTSTVLDKPTLAKAKNLACIALASTGWDRIDIEEATRRGIAVLGLPSHNKDIDAERDGNFVSVAEHTILLILAILGDFYHANQSLKDGRWEKKLLIGQELAGKTVGLVGVGRIASLVARRLTNFRVNLIGYDKFVTSKQAREIGVELVSLDVLCKTSDIISIHMPKTTETIGMLGVREFSLMKNGVFIVNTARAAIMDESILIESLKNGKVLRAALDVFHNEPHGINWELIRMSNVISTPHIGGSTHEAWRRISLLASENAISFFRGDVRNRINI